MTLLEKLNEVEGRFKTDGLADSLRTLLAMEQQFVNKKRGQVLNGILLAYSNTFVEDRAVISELLTVRSSVKRQTVEPRTKPLRKVNFTKHNWDAGCSTCSKSNMARMESKLEENKRALPESLEDLEGAKDWRNILAAFGVNTEQMIKVAKEGGIKIGNIKAPEKIAIKIFTHLRNEGMTTE